MKKVLKTLAVVGLSLTFVSVANAVGKKGKNRESDRKAKQSTSKMNESVEDIASQVSNKISVSAKTTNLEALFGSNKGILKAAKAGLKSTESEAVSLLDLIGVIANQKQNNSEVNEMIDFVAKQEVLKFEGESKKLVTSFMDGIVSNSKNGMALPEALRIQLKKMGKTFEEFKEACL